MISSRKYRLSRRAIRDLVAIHNFIFDANPAAARKLVDGIERKIASIARIGFTGVPRQELGADLRGFTYKKHCIYFRVMVSHIHVVRILHGRQDVTADDFPEDDSPESET